MATRSRILGLRRALNAVRGCSFSSVSRNPTQRVSPLLASRHNNVSSLPSCRRWAEHSQVRFRSWTELRDCKHWLITLSFPNPKPSRDEMIDAYVKTLANVLGSEEEAKKKIYALSTTVYTGFQCNIDEATSEKLKDQPLVDWVLPDGYGDPELGIFGGDRYNNGVITPDPNPPKPYSERRGPPRNYGTPRSPIERHGDFRARDGPVQGDHPRGDFVRSVPPTQRQGGFRPADGRGYNQDVGSRTHTDGRPPMQNEPVRSFDWKDSMQGTREPFQG